MKIKTIKKKFNNIILGAVIISIALLSIGCDDDDDNDDDPTGNWIELSDFEGIPRTDAVVFTIGDKAYLGTGYDGSDRLVDFWEYDPLASQWIRKADFPGTARNGAVGFGTDTKGYIGSGFDGVNKLRDFWEYDPISNSWVQIADFGGTARYSAVAFAINNKGYVGTGYDGNALKDFWEYDPSTNQWTQKYSLGGGKRSDAITFVIDGKAYVGTGIDNGVYENDFWVYDPAVNQWTEMRPISNISDDDYDDDYNSIIGINKVAFAINGMGYVATGGAGTADAIVWEYNPTSDLWDKKTNLEAPGRIEAVGFAVGDLGYLATGRNSSYYLDDLWGFRPDDEQVDLDKTSIVSPL
jgi:N-acetylneuraminic acid mutarotase